MKTKTVSFIISFFLLGCILFAEDYRVKVTQNVQIPGGQYALDVPSPSIKYTSLPNGNLNLRYNFDLNAKKDDKDSLIDWKIEFPSGISYFVTSFDGLESFEFDGEQVPALIEHTTYTECFLPVRKNGSGFIEIQLSLPRNYVGADIPIKINFDGYKKKTNILGIVATVGGAVIFGIPGVIVAGTASYFAGREKASAQIEQKFEIVKDKYKKFSLSDSLKRYRVQVR